ncbi:hypothetical protein NDU88_006162 [Pleurodeles waltl]|uniref:Uncharacterized protein n=1 Tax=Pleurodeles waltl TaxID=8319 RepID=A0AAV7TCN9_PLEWA|nr:hypothetical protein NDU88_006162 [Pleurodeles waltl]
MRRGPCGVRELNITAKPRSSGGASMAKWHAEEHIVHQSAYECLEVIRLTGVVWRVPEALRSIGGWAVGAEWSVLYVAPTGEVSSTHLGVSWGQSGCPRRRVLPQGLKVGTP